MKNKLHQKGFSLIEVLLTLVLFTILVGISSGVYYGLILKNDLAVAANQVAQCLNRAGFLSQASGGDSTWGVHVQSGSVTIFKGTFYSGGDANNETYSMSSSIVSSGLSDIVFDKATGLPQSNGSIILTAKNGDQKTISINSAGTINY